MKFLIKNFSLNYILALSFNQPNLSSTVTWNRNGITFANESVIGKTPEAIFINTNNTIYTIHMHEKKILIWNENNLNLTSIDLDNLSVPTYLFVTSNADIYISDSWGDKTVQRWKSETNTFETVMNVNSACSGLFIDINDNLYCSLYEENQVMKTNLNDSSMTSIPIVGTGSEGSNSNELSNPGGIFVDVNFDLFVADTNNHRVQFFSYGETHGITVAGERSYKLTIPLLKPDGITLDANKYLYIVDRGNHRVIGEGPYGFRCLVGCYSVGGDEEKGGGSQSNQLKRPIAMSFDTFGNIFVVESRNNRIQKFELISSVISLNQPQFCPNQTWNRNGITFVNPSIIGKWTPDGLFINTNNTIYTIHKQQKKIIIWNENSLNVRYINLSHFLEPRYLFVTSNSNIYFNVGDDGNRTVQKWDSERSTFETVMNVNSECYVLFIDINDNLYCSLPEENQVVKKNLNDSSMTSIPVAGTGNKGSNSNELSWPEGIFVDVNFDLFVADYENNRIQLFSYGATNATTIAGEKSVSPTISLHNPRAITLDANKYLYIVESAAERVVGEGPYGFRCLVGCYEREGGDSQLAHAMLISFDNFGNMFVLAGDEILKFSIENSCGFPFNQPEICSKSVWNRNGITVADQFQLGLNPSSIFINKQNSIYSINREKQQILFWNENDSAPSKKIPTNYDNSSSLFVSSIGEIFIDNGINGRVEKWIFNRNVSTTVMIVSSSCFDLFIDIKNFLYCSMSKNHLVIKKDIYSPVMGWEAVAGTSEKGSTSVHLNDPRGIFVDIKFDTYVADCGNDRIQRISSGQMEGTTLVGSTLLAKRQYLLSCPTAIILDIQQFLFIVDSKNRRILRSGPTDIFCVIGCDGLNIKSTQLLLPTSLAFDNFGNLFVVDSGNHRIQKFEYSSNSCDMFSVIEWTNSSILAKNSQIYSQGCDRESYYYESFEIKVPENRYYTIWSSSAIDTYGYIYEETFNPLNPDEHLFTKNDDGGSENQFKFDLPLYNDTKYILVVTTYSPMITGNIIVHMSGVRHVLVTRLSSQITIQSNYSSEITTNSPKYCRDYKSRSYHYETLEINVKKPGPYVIWSESEYDTYGYLYKDNFDPLQPFGNLLFQHSGKCNQHQLKFFVDLEANIKYILVITTYYPNHTGNFSIFISGDNDVTINRFNSKQQSCSIGDRCHFYSTTIGLPLDDILRGEIQSNITLSNQSISIKISAAFTIIMFIIGFINSLLCFLTFKSKEERQNGCGLYLFTLSITSFITSCMFSVNFWFSLITEIHFVTDISILRGGRLVIEPLLKLFLYYDTWLNACIAIERAGRVFSGVNFDRNKSKRIVQCIIFILPLCIMASLIHEPLHRNMFEYNTETGKAYVNKSDSPLFDVRNKTFIDTIYQSTTQRQFWCVVRYSSSIQYYNTGILYFHLIIPFLANLFSALFIIFQTARQRSTAQTNQSLQEHFRQQLHEHKHLIISPIILLILTMPRLIISSLSGCKRTSKNIWIYLMAYFFSFTPSIFTFVIFVIPSSLYMKNFKRSFNICRCQTAKKSNGKQILNE
ncbi:unnamed protein product [Adineta ricciae]|uniref:Uncharacterized protein n=1 Tax=Adineta ricciae TaxID=249248 RepID=A0A814JAN5_ADIRI|nr:unnamed protein product [Adineta ricciae]CAF1036781.1 unnamed protein product [Adineta ricciae]